MDIVDLKLHDLEENEIKYIVNQENDSIWHEIEVGTFQLSDGLNLSFELEYEGNLESEGLLSVRLIKTNSSSYETLVGPLQFNPEYVQQINCSIPPGRVFDTESFEIQLIISNIENGVVTDKVSLFNYAQDGIGSIFPIKTVELGENQPLWSFSWESEVFDFDAFNLYNDIRYVPISDVFELNVNVNHKLSDKFLNNSFENGVWSDLHLEAFAQIFFLIYLEVSNQDIYKKILETQFVESSDANSFPRFLKHLVDGLGFGDVNQVKEPSRFMYHVKCKLMGIK